MFSRPGASEELFLEACRIARVDEFAEENWRTLTTRLWEEARRENSPAASASGFRLRGRFWPTPGFLILDEATVEPRLRIGGDDSGRVCLT